MHDCIIWLYEDQTTEDICSFVSSLHVSNGEETLKLLERHLVNNWTVQRHATGASQSRARKPWIM